VLGDKIVHKQDIDSEFLLLQINDSLFPIGSYSHSFGLETYIQKGFVRDEKTVMQYLYRNLKGSFMHTELLCASFAYDYALQMHFKKLIELDRKLYALKAAREIREASEKLGQRFLKTVSALQLSMDHTVLDKYVHAGKVAGVSANHCVAYGVLCAASRVNKAQALRTYLYAQASAIVTNCVKTVPLSQTVGQNILSKCYPVFVEILEEIENLKQDDIGLSMPGFEIRCMQHETLYSRLYMS